MKRANINLYDACNYRCPFCYLGARKQSRNFGRLATREGMRLLVDFFQPDDEWELFLGGGEVSIHPYFIELCQQITKRHFLNFQTNLSFEVRPFLSAVPSARVKGISATLQPEGEVALETFIEKVLTLKAAGIHVGLAYICTPERIAGIPRLFRRFSDLGLPISIQGLVGPYRGKLFPRDYTEAERQVIRGHSILYASILNLDLDQKSSSKGEFCSAGHQRVVIDGLTGVIKPCGGLPPIGNLYEGTMRLFPQPLRCPVATCTCELHDSLWDYHQRELAPYYIQRKPIAPEKWREFMRRARRDWENVEPLMELRSDLRRRPVYIWGAGQAGQTVLELLTDVGIPVRGFIDSDARKHGSTVAGLPIVAPPSAEENGSGNCELPFIIISSQFAHEIELRVRQAGLAWGADYCYP